MAKFFLAAGHGWRSDGSTDPGAVSGSNIERDIAINLIDQAVNILKSQDTKGREIVVINHRLVDAVPSINALSTDNAHDLCMELHLNANSGAPGTGTETYYGLPQLANEMNGALVATLGLPNRGVKDGSWLYFNNSTNCGSCLVEIGFINNSNDMAVIFNRGALALAKAILVACGSSYVDPQIAIDAKAKAEAIRIAAEQAKLAEALRLKQEAEAKAKLEADKLAEKLKQEAEAKAKADKLKADAEAKAKEGENVNTIDRFKSPVVLTSVLAQILLVVALFVPQISETVKIVGTVIIEVLTLFGVLNNPTDKNNF